MTSVIDAIKNPLALSAPDGVPGDADMQAINSYAAVTIPPDNIFITPCVMANRNMSSHCIAMAESTLKNFARGGVGTPVHVMHDRLIRNVGIVYAAHYDELTGEARAAEYTIRGRVIKDSPSFGGGGRELSTNQEIEDIKSGLRRAVSVGPGGAFYRHICRLCGKDVLSWYYTDDEDGCKHIPGMRYDGVFATADLEDAELVELSHCDAGAIGGALIGSIATENKPLINPLKFAVNVAAKDFTPTPIPDTLMRNGAFQYKAVSMFRANTVKRGQYTEWLDIQRMKDETKSHFTPSKEKDKQMDLKAFLDSLKARGIHVPANVITAAESGDMSVLAQYFAEQVGRQTTDTERELLSFFSSVGIASKADAEKALASAKHGETYAAAVKERLSKALIRRYGKDAGPSLIALYEVYPADKQEEFAKTFEIESNQRFGMGKCADDERKPAGRVSRNTEYRVYGATETEEPEGEETEDDTPESQVMAHAKKTVQSRYGQENIKTPARK